MRYRIGDKFQNSDGSLECEAIEIFDEGREALLFFNNGHRERQNFMGFMSEKQWHRIGANNLSSS